MRATKNSWVLWAAALVSIGVFAAGASAAQINYEMSVSPLSDTVPMTNVTGSAGDGFGNGTTDNASPWFAGLQNGTNGTAGTARFVDSSDTSGNNGMLKQGFAGGYTVDMRIFVELSTTGAGGDPNGRTAMAVSEANNHSRAISFLNSNDAGLGGPVAAPNAFRFRIGINVTGTGTEEISVPNNPANPTSFHMVRMVIPNNTTLKLYDLENDLDPGAGVNWNLLGTYTGLTGNTGRPSSLNSTTTGGIELNSESGGNTRSSKFSLDWLRINDSAALGATDPIMVPEPATLALMITGLLPLMMRRRR